jgi:subtilisin family serine protease
VSEKNDEHTPSESEVVEALQALRQQQAQSPNDFTRKQHISAMNKELNPSTSRRPWIAVAAAAALVLGTGSFIALSSDSSRTSDQLASESSEIPDLKPVDFVTDIPFNRSEEYVMITVDASRVDAIGGELSTVLGNAPSVVGVNSKNTTFVVPASAAQQISDTTGITVVADTPMKSINEQSPVPSWGLDRIDAVDTALNNSYKYVSTGAGALVYVIDTGIYSGHSDLSGRVISGYTAINDGNGTQDCNGHGTHVAGTVAGTTYGVAKSATLVAVRVLDCAGSGFSSSVVAGINWAVASHPGGPGIINLSLGGGANSAVDDAVAAATRAGLVVVAAAGNSGADACNFSPARAPSAITIGATDKNDSRASYSNFGSCVDMYAPGTGITSTWISGTSATRTISGTSMAAPHVAGLAARLSQSQPGISSSGISDALTVSNVAGGSLTIANFVEDETSVTTTTAPTTTTVPASDDTTTTTTVAPSTTTTAPRNSKSPNTKAPGQNKKAATPKEFALGYESVNGTMQLVATWNDDRTPESYAIECTASAPTPTSVATTRFIVQKEATTLNAGGSVQTTLTLSPTESLFCWVVAYVGADNSARSNVARINAAPRTTTSTTPAPNPSAPGRGPGATTPANVNSGGSTPTPNTPTPNTPAPNSPSNSRPSNKK